MMEDAAKDYVEKAKEVVDPVALALAMEPNPVAIDGKVEEIKQDEPVQEEVIETKKEENLADSSASASFSTFSNR